MKVRDIVKEWLKNEEYDGLCCEYCGCELDDLMPCGGWNSGIDLCEPGYKSICGEECVNYERDFRCREHCYVEAEEGDSFIYKPVVKGGYVR